MVESSMVEFIYQNPYPTETHAAQYRLLTNRHVGIDKLRDRVFLIVDLEGLTFLARSAMRDVSFYLRAAHNQQVAEILRDCAASENDRSVALALLRNAVVSAQGMLPICQDTGTATVIAKKGQYVLTDGNDCEAIAKGIYQTYTDENLRYSQVVPLDMYQEKNSACNLPAQIDIYATEGGEYEFLFIAKGGGSANKTALFQESRAILAPATLEQFLIDKMNALGTSACPPYHVAFVVGGTSAEACLKTVKLASAHELDGLPTTGDEGGRAFRDIELEKRLLLAAYRGGLGAQFGGKYFAHDIRVIRLPRHAASLPIAIGVSCSADRNIKAKINRDGIWLEQLDTDPGRWLRENKEDDTRTSRLPIILDLHRPVKEILAQLSRFQVATPLLLNGTLVVARDMAHAKLKERLEKGQGLPDYFKNHPVYYAGPAKTPKGMACGSFGPTTAGRMDSYVDLFQANGGSLVMIAKGNRSQQVIDACKKHGGFYLGSIGGPAAILAQESIKSVKVLDYPELGMESVWQIEVQNFPAFILIDDKGNDFFGQSK
jgi:fumarate hydratase class I